jgi:hypothetical protein
MDSCSECGSPISANVNRCLTCGADVGAPNVRAAGQANEKVALKARFDDAVLRAQARVSLRKLTSLNLQLNAPPQ